MAWAKFLLLADEENQKDREKWIGVYIAVLAVILAICSMGGGNAAKEATLKNIEASNTWAFFQAKNMRRHVLRLQADDLELRLAHDGGLTENAKGALRVKIADYRRQDEVLTRDPEKEASKREGLDQLWERGKTLETQRDIAMRKDPYFDYAEALLQIAIVLASVAIISRRGQLLLMMSAVLGAAGALLTINGFTLALALPFIG